jgi:hypothetical protein
MHLEKRDDERSESGALETRSFHLSRFSAALIANKKAEELCRLFDISIKKTTVLNDGRLS